MVVLEYIPEKHIYERSTTSYANKYVPKHMEKSVSLWCSKCSLSRNSSIKLEPRKHKIHLRDLYRGWEIPGCLPPFTYVSPLVNTHIYVTCEEKYSTTSEEVGHDYVMYGLIGFQSTAREQCMGKAVLHPATVSRAPRAEFYESLTHCWKQIRLTVKPLLSGHLPLPGRLNAHAQIIFLREVVSGHR